MKNKIIKRTLAVIFSALFFVGILLCIIGTNLATYEVSDHTKIQPELVSPAEIDTVIYSEKHSILYVCYSDAMYVNAYTADGEFLWAVGAPYMRNPIFALEGDNDLVIYYNANDEAYIYNAADGTFKEKRSSEGIDTDFDYLLYSSSFVGDYYYNSFNVYKVSEGGELTKIISRPDYYIIFTPLFGFLVSLVGITGLAILYFTKIRKRYLALERTVSINDSRALGIFKYYRIFTKVHIIYAALDIVFGFFGGWLCIVILPLALHLIISTIITGHMTKADKLSDSENELLSCALTLEIGSFGLAFLSVLAASLIAAIL